MRDASKAFLLLQLLLLQEISKMQMFDAINIRIAIHTVHRHYIFRMTVFYHSQIAKFAFYSIYVYFRVQCYRVA